MLYTEIFYSIQGECVSVGRPSIFVRLFGCNLKCSWCDTQYSWKPKFKKDAMNANPKELAEKILKIMTETKCNRVVWTGGEPSLFLADIKKTIENLPENTINEIETNGTIQIPAGIFDLIVCSPKLKNSGNSKQLRAIKLKDNKNIHWKFVFNNPNDFNEIEEIQNQHNIESSRIWIMPIGETRDEQLFNDTYTCEHSLAKGYNFSPRLHVYLWSNQKLK